MLAPVAVGSPSSSSDEPPAPSLTIAPVPPCCTVLTFTDRPVETFTADSCGTRPKTIGRWNDTVSTLPPTLGVSLTSTPAPSTLVVTTADALPVALAAIICGRLVLARSPPKIAVKVLPVPETVTLPLRPFCTVVTLVTGPPAPAVVMSGSGASASVPPKVIVYCVPEPSGAEVTATLPSRPPMLDSELSASCTCWAVALNGSGAVVWPLNVRMNVPVVLKTATVCTSVAPPLPSCVIVELYGPAVSCGKFVLASEPANVTWYVVELPTVVEVTVTLPVGPMLVRAFRAFWTLLFANGPPEAATPIG